MRMASSMRSFVARPELHFKPEVRALNSQNLVFLLRMGLGRTSGRPKSRAFVDFLFAQFPEKNSAIAGPHDVGSRIVIPQELISRCLSIKKSTRLNSSHLGISYAVFCLKKK